MQKILLFIMLFTVSLTVSAQRGKRSMEPKDRAKKEVEGLKKQLGLNEKQEKDCFNAHLNHYKKQKEIFKKAGDRKKIREEMVKERDVFQKKLQKIFTKEQYTMYQNIQKEKQKKMREKMGSRGKGRGGRVNKGGRGRGIGM